MAQIIIWCHESSAHIVTQTKISITTFKEMLAMSMLGLNLPNTNGPEPTQQEQHKLQNIAIRRRCVVCYENVSAELGPKAAQSKTPRSPYQCSVVKKHFV